MAGHSRKVTKNIRIDPGKYVNSETGEMMDSELKGVKHISANQSTDLVKVISNDYCTMDTTIMRYLSTQLNRQELGSINIMALDLKTDQNLVYNGNIPHTNETLQEKLGIASRNTFTLLIRKLMHLGVLYQLKGKIFGEVRMIYMMNPYLARKRSLINGTQIKFFDKFKDPGKPGQFPNDVQ